MVLYSGLISGTEREQGPESDAPRKANSTRPLPARDECAWVGTRLAAADCLSNRRTKMDCTGKTKSPREVPNQTPQDQSDAALSDITRGEPGSAFLSDASKPIGAHPRSEVTGRHDAGSGANETADG